MPTTTTAPTIAAATMPAPRTKRAACRVRLSYASISINRVKPGEFPERRACRAVVCTGCVFLLVESSKKKVLAADANICMPLPPSSWATHTLVFRRAVFVRSGIPCVLARSAKAQVGACVVEAVAVDVVYCHPLWRAASNHPMKKYVARLSPGPAPAPHRIKPFALAPHRVPPVRGNALVIFVIHDCDASPGEFDCLSHVSISLRSPSGLPSTRRQCALR